MTAKKDYTGQKFNRLTFIGPTNERRFRGIVWELLCECGKSVFSISSHIVSGKTKSCGCYRIDQFTLEGLKKRKYPPEISSARKVWGHRYNEDGLDFETFYQMSKKECYYCGQLPYRTMNIGGFPSRQRGNTACKGISELQREEGNFTYNGLDRIDNTKGHTADNLVPACWTCNDMKGKMTHDEFLDHIEKMYHNTRRLRLVSSA